VFLMFAIPGNVFPFFAIAVVSFVSARSARPAASRITISSETLRCERLTKGRLLVKDYPWTSVGTVHVFQTSNRTWNINVIVNARRTVNLQLAVAEKNLIDAEAAAIEAHRIRLDSI
jgi:hypothetical protein